jgi:hypothetical protein
VETKDKQEEWYYEYQHQLTYIIPKDRKTCKDTELRDKNSFKTSEYANIRHLGEKGEKNSLRNFCVTIILKWLYYLYLHYQRKCDSCDKNVLFSRCFVTACNTALNM